MFNIPADTLAIALPIANMQMARCFLSDKGKSKNRTLILFKSCISCTIQTKDRWYNRHPSYLSLDNNRTNENMSRIARSQNDVPYLSSQTNHGSTSQGIGASDQRMPPYQPTGPLAQ